MRTSCFMKCNKNDFKKQPTLDGSVKSLSSQIFWLEFIKSTKFHSPCTCTLDSNVDTFTKTG